MAEEGGPAGGISISGLANFVFFILACMSAHNTDKTMVYDACGSSLRATVIADIVANWLFWIIALVIWAVLICTNASTTTQSITAVIVALAYTIAAICLSAFSIQYSVYAHNNKNCTDALSSQDGGLDSPSANIGSPLLMIIGYIYGSIYAILSLVFLICTCCFACACCAHHH